MVNDKFEKLYIYTNRLLAYWRENFGQGFDLRLLLEEFCKVLELEGALILTESPEQILVPRAHYFKTNFDLKKLTQCLNEIISEKYQTNQDLPIFVNEIDTNNNLCLNLDNLAIIPFKKDTKNFLILINKKERFYVKGPYFVGELFTFLQHFITLTELLNQRISEISALLTKIKELFWGSSRKILYQYAKDFLRKKREAESFLSSEDISFAEWVYWDTKTQLEVLPSHHIVSIPSGGGEATSSGCLDNRTQPSNPLPQRAWQRCQIFQSYKSENLKLDSDIRFSEQIKENGKLSLFSSKEAPHFEEENLHLPQEIINNIYRFYCANHLKVESTRTELFRLYFIGLSLQKKPDPQIKENLLKFFDKKGINELKDFLSSFLARWQDEKYSYLTTEWLVTWFGIKFLREFPWNNLSNLSPLPLGRFFCHFSAYFLYILHIIRNLGEPSLLKFSDIPSAFSGFLEAALYLISEYAHEVYNLTREFPLYESLSHLWTSEVVLYSLKPSYRDHLHHVINVCLLGLAFIEAGFLEKIQNKDTIKNKNKLVRNWIITGLLHDIGYCVDLPQYLIDHIKHVAISPCIKKYCSFIEESISKAEQNLYSDLNNWLPKQWNCEKIDHGVISAFYILFARGKESNYIDLQTINSWKEDLHDACLAAISHNLPPSYEGQNPPVIFPDKHPLSFLLLICDHIQEWDRPRIDRSRLQQHLIADLLSRPSLLFLDSKDIIRHLKINFKWDKKTHKIIPNSKTIWKVNLIYKDTKIVPSLQPAIIWIHNTFDFQKVNFSNCSEDFTLEFICVHPKTPQKKYWEFDLFRDFITAQNLNNIFHNWCNRALISDEGWFNYQNSESEKTETFTFIFSKEKSADLVLKKLPSDLYSRFMNWKNSLQMY